MNKITRIFIIDDNREAIEVLRMLLESYYSVDIVGTSTDTVEAMDRVIDTEPDILFIDIELPSMSGLQFCSMIRNEVRPEMKVVFYTAHDKYLIDAIRKQAFDFLLKPATEQELSKIMTRYYENKLASMNAVTQRDAGTPPIILVVNAINEHLPLTLDDIGYFRYNQDRKLWEVVCCNKQTHILRRRTTAEIILNYSPSLIQIHKRYIVNIEHIKIIQEYTCILDDPLSDVSELKISKNYRHSLMQAFYNL